MTYLNFLSGKPEKRMTLFCLRNKGSLNLNRTHVVDFRVMLKKTCCFKLLRTIGLELAKIAGFANSTSALDKFNRQ